MSNTHTDLVRSEIIEVVIQERKHALLAEREVLVKQRKNVMTNRSKFTNDLLELFPCEKYNKNYDRIGLGSIFQSVSLVGEQYRVTLSLIDTDVITNPNTGLHQLFKHVHVPISNNDKSALKAMFNKIQSLDEDISDVDHNITNLAVDRKWLNVKMERQSLDDKGHGTSLDLCRQALANK